MKKILTLMAALIGCATMSFAQVDLVATLQHEGTFTHYYGVDALKSAYNAAADDGDTITLSPGTFDSPFNFTKGITLRGAGIDSDAKSFINHQFNVAATDANRIITIEGINFSDLLYVFNDASGNGQGKIRFIKDVLRGGFSATYYTANYSTEKGPEVRIYDSSIWSFGIQGNAYPDIMVYNSGVFSPASNFGTTTSAFINCSIHDPDGSARNLNFYNCLFWTDGSWRRLPNTALCYNCLSVDMDGLFNDVSGEYNMYAKGEDVWKDGVLNGELTEEAQKTYLGSDGTQVGIYGGNYPYNTKVQYPVITSFTSDVQTSKQGILNINVEVDGE